MKKSFPLGFALLVMGLIIAGGAGVAVQWKKTLLLRGDVAALQVKAAELKRLQAENERLRAQQIPAAELARLRADHAAVARLRVELQALQRGSANRR